MSEGHNFESHEIPPQVKVDFESVLERSEIKSSKTLEGHEYIKEVELEDGTKALFRPEVVSSEADLKGADPQKIRNAFKEKLRADLEILAFSIDRLLKFNLIPTVVRREVEGEKGALQRFVSEAKPAKNFGLAWEQLVERTEILKAAVFDYLMDARDRNTGNFLIDSDSKKLWLIDNDFLMLMNKNGIPSDIRFRAEKLDLLDITPGIVGGLRGLLDRMASFVGQFDPALSQKLEDIKKRAELLVETKKIPAQTYLA